MGKDCDCQRAEKLAAEVEKLRRILRVIYTWSTYRDEQGNRPAFDPENIADVCRGPMKGVNDVRHDRQI